MSIFDTIDNNDFDKFKNLIIDNPKLLFEKDEYNWECFPLLVDFQLYDYIKFSFEYLSKEDYLNFEKNIFELLYDKKDEKLFDLFLENPNIDFNTKLNNNETILHYLVNNKENYLANKVFESNKINDYFSKLNDNSELLNFAIKSNNELIFNELINHEDYIFNNSFIYDAVKYNNINFFSELYSSYDKSKIDDLFNYALNLKNIEAIDYIINSGDIILGNKQITELISIISTSEDTQNKNLINIIDYLFLIKTNFNDFVTQSGDNIWSLCISNNNDYLFDKLINETNHSVNVEVDDVTPLFYAIDLLNHNYVKKLLSKKAEPNYLDHFNNNALMYAINKDVYSMKELEERDAIINEILNYRVDLTQINKNNDSALSMAIRKKQMNVVSKLFWKGANLLNNPIIIDDKKEIFQLNPLGVLETIDGGLNQKNINNFIALKQLGFDLNQKNENNESFIMFFLKEGYLSNFNVLLPVISKEAINQLDSNGNTLSMNAIKKKNDNYLSLILSQFDNIDFSIRNNNKEDIYDLCAKFGNAKKVELLLNNDNNLSISKISKILPILLKKGNINNYWNSLVNIYPDILNFKDIDNNSILMLAASTNNINNIKFILDNTEFKIDLKNYNTYNENLISIIKSIPNEEDSNEILNLLDKKKVLKK